MKTFQLVLLLVFGLFFVGALIMFAVLKGDSASTLPPITVWGTLPASTFNNVLDKARQDAELAAQVKDLQITYVEKRDSDFDREFIEALADGKGPDAVIITQDMLLRHKNKFYPILPTSLSTRTFKDSFIPISGLFQDNTATYALPLFVDPLVMYWNVDMFNNAGYARPPKGWVELPDLALSMSKRDTSGNITKSAVALGEFSNINNAKEILSTLFLQVGAPIIGYGSDGRLRSGLNAGKVDANNAPFSPAPTASDEMNAYSEPTDGLTLSPAASALRFYTDFANPAKKVYSWNHALARSRDRFASGDLAIYFGYASEKPLLQAKNPSISFDVAMMPQISNATSRLTYGKLYGFAIQARSPNVVGAYNIGTLLSSPRFSAYFAKYFNAAPARIDALAYGYVLNTGVAADLAENPEDPGRLARAADQEIFNQAAISARGWLDPDRAQSDSVFRTMVENVISGQYSVANAVSTAESTLSSIIQSIR